MITHFARLDGFWASQASKRGASVFSRVSCLGLVAGLTPALPQFSRPTNRLDAFMHRNDNGLWPIWYDGSWHPWEPLGNSLTSAPTATFWDPNQLDVFARGADAGLQRIWFDGNWQPWSALWFPTHPHLSQWRNF